MSWSPVAVFYVVACALSWPFFWWRDLHAASWEAWDTLGVPKGLAPAAGPAAGALLALWLFRRTHRRTVTLVGSSAWRSLAFAAAPIALLMVVGIEAEQPHWTGLLAGLAYLAYALGEELGWRGFLQDALRPLPPLQRYGLVGLLWGAWHFTTFTQGPLPEVAVRLAMLLTLAWVAGSWGIGLATDRSGSLLVAAMLHLVFNLARALPARQAALVLAPSAAAWFLLLRGWPRRAPVPIVPPAGRQLGPAPR